jgi:DNA primase catalytic subunit
MLTARNVLEYYSREDVQNALLELGRNREVVGVFRNGSFGTRPNVILYAQDIVSMVRSGVLEFHSSLERWSNPMAIRTDNPEGLRTGWDLILDLDCRDFGHAKLAARILYRALEDHGLKSISLKYTGGKGFHLGIPWESLPGEVNYKPTVNLFPGIARQIGLYIKEQIRPELEKGLLRLNNPEQLAGISGKPLEKIVTEEGIDPFQIVDIDPVLISPRHLFRMPYSLNRNTGLVSLPVAIRELDEFEKEHASTRGLRVRRLFLQPGKPGEASALVAQASDWWEIYKRKIENETKRIMRSTERVPEDAFPPCINNISAGLPDGRKRSIHILLNFLRSCNWSWQDTETYLYAWNQRNIPPLNENYIRGHIRYHRARKKVIPPPNCKHQESYVSFGVCAPDHICGGSAKTIKNPAVYPFRKMATTKKYKKLTEKLKRKKKKAPSGPPTASGMYTSPA